MHTVCDEHGNFSFKSDGMPAPTPGMQEVISDREEK